MSDRTATEVEAILATDITTLLAEFPSLGGEFTARGLGAFCTAEAREGIGRFLHLETVLRRREIDALGFVNECILPVIHEQDDDLGELRDVPTSEVINYGAGAGSVLALLPCGLKRSYHAGIKEFASAQPEDYAQLDFLIQGNVNHELSYYQHLSRVQSEGEIPEMLLVSDFNCLFHHDFMERFVNPGLFAASTGYPGADASRAFQECGYFDPQNQYMMLTANPLIMVVDRARLGGKAAPRSWRELIEGDYRNEVSIRGDGSFFCNGVLLPLYKEFGFDGLRKLAAQVKNGLHPSQMVKELSQKSPQRSAIYIIPYFFAQTISGNNECELIWPEEGAIISPVFMVAKERSLPVMEPLIRYFYSERFGRIQDNAYFPPVSERASSFDPADRNFYWLGWDFLRGEDSGRIKQEIEQMFVPEVESTR